ncbi:MAG: NRDE family protein [Gammaproteobacteria bacterium]|nr:NRDE family protein [Gammaproteobacteria bacterium]
MCILFIAVERHRRYPLVIAANRDEYHARPSAPLHRWAGDAGILAGRDELAGGTWFGVNARGRIAAVTNRRAAESGRRAAAGQTMNAATVAATVDAKSAAGDATVTATVNAGSAAGDATVAATENAATVAATESTPSRGALPARFLRGADSIAEFGEFLRAAHRDFRPFNLLYGEPGRLHCFAGGEANSGARPRLLGRGFHSISNGAMDDPWPKMARGVELLKAQIAGDRDLCADNLARMMKDEAPADGAGDGAAASTATAAAGTVDDARRASIFITGARYGSRATTLLFAAPGRFEVYEYAYAARGVAAGRRHVALTVTDAA